MLSGKYAPGVAQVYGKYVDGKGFALVKTLPVAQQETDGLETVLEFNVYLTQ